MVLTQIDGNKNHIENHLMQKLRAGCSSSVHHKQFKVMSTESPAHYLQGQSVGLDHATTPPNPNANNRGILKSSSSERVDAFKD